MTDLFAFKILTREQFADLKEKGEFLGAPVDIRDGYIHLSTRAQAAGTAAKHFAGQDNLILAMIDLAPLAPAIKWEVSRGGQLFPHLYAPLPLSAVTSHAKLRIGDDGHHQFPAGF